MSTEGDYGGILSQHCPVRQQLEMFRATLAAALEDPEELRRRAKVEAILQDAGVNDQHVLAAMVRVTSEAEITEPVDLALVADLVGRLDEVLAAFPEARRGSTTLRSRMPIIGATRGRWSTTSSKRRATRRSTGSRSRCGRCPVYSTRRSRRSLSMGNDAGQGPNRRRGSDPGFSGRRRDEPLWTTGGEQPLNWSVVERIQRQVKSVEDRLPQDQPRSRESLVEEIHHRISAG